MSKDFNLGEIDLGRGADIDGFLSSPSNEEGGIYTTSSILQTLMPESSNADFELNSIQTQGSPGLDALFAQEPQLVEVKSSRRIVASIGDLMGFTRISAETLVNKSQN